MSGGASGPKEIEAPAIRADRITPGLSAKGEDGDLALYLRIETEDANPGEFLVEVGRFVSRDGGHGVEGIDPYNLAGSLMAAADSLVRLAALNAGVDHQEAEKVIRRRRREARLLRHQEVEEIVAVSHCHYCQRSVALIVEGVSYCKRHAEEHGVRPKGKIT